MLLIFLLACPVAPKKYRTPLLLLCGIGILLTFSRAGMIAWSLLWLYLLARRKLSAIGAIAVLALIAVPLAMGSMASYLNTRTEFSGGINDLEQRLTFLSDKRLDDQSAQERATVLEAGWKKFLANPITGIGACATGTGFTTTWPHPVSTHNQLIALAAEYGVAGIVLWGWLGLLLLRGNFFQNSVMQTAGVLLFVLMTFFTHNMLDFPNWLLTIALLSQRTKRAESAPVQVSPHAAPFYR
jgi:O-antigen ligase